MSSPRTTRLFARALLPVACFVAALAAALGVSAEASLPAGDAPAASSSAQGTPARALPPGASPGDPAPSRLVFPEQTITIRFDHAKHAAMGASCTDCHAQAKTSTQARDRMMPAPRVCDDCHGADHAELSSVKPGAAGLGTCETCHLGYDPEKPGEVARMKLPAARLRSNHALHAERNIGCEQCHGAVQEIGLATREQLPRMRGCLVCHGMTGPGQGRAQGDCAVCHETGGDGKLVTDFPEGKLVPPRWLGGMEHSADFLTRHKRVAANDSKACGSCHAERFCTDCHDGKVRPRSVHPGDYLGMHPVEARLEPQRCTSCHQQQSFCATCHQRSGVTMTASPGAAKAKGRFHPPRELWSDAPRTRQHHAWEAQRNLNACVSCHTERDCASCHASRAAGGMGMNPHPAGFASRCATALRKNARPCLVCHEPRALKDLCR